MEILFANNKLKGIFDSDKALKKRYGDEQAAKIKRRMAVLQGATCLAEVPAMKPDRCHALKGDRKGQFAVDIKWPYRLVFKIAGEPELLDDGGIDLRKVRQIVIMEVEDYHGE